MGIVKAFWRVGISGFSLLEVMVALSVLSVGGYFLVTLVKNSLTLQRQVNTNEDVRSFMRDISTILGNPQACFNTFGSGSPKAIGGFSRDKILTHEGAVRYEVGGVYGSGKSKLLKIQLGGKEGDIDARTKIAYYTPMGPYMGIALASIDWEHTGKDRAGPQMLQRFFKVNTTLNGAGEITSCFAVAGDQDELWSRSALNWENIFYIEGNVGIGTQDPKTKLEVNGEVKIGNTSSNCESNNEGSMRYNSAKKSMEFCNGSNWKDVSDGPSGSWCGIKTSSGTNVSCKGSSVPDPMTGGDYSTGSGCPSGYVATQFSFNLPFVPPYVPDSSLPAVSGGSPGGPVAFTTCIKE